MQTNVWWFYQFSAVEERIQKLAKGADCRHHRKVDNHAAMASQVICFLYGIDLTGSIPVLHCQGLSFYLFGLYFDDEYPHQKICARCGAQERGMVVDRVCCEGEGHPNEIVALPEGR